MTAASSRSLALLSCLLLLAACDAGTTPPADDAAFVTDAFANDAYDPYATAPTCTSGHNWTYGDSGSVLMHPGQACLNCHSMYFRAPNFAFAGTVYPSAHEPDDCNGADGLNGDEMHVIVTDANGTVTDVFVNQSGNFYSYNTVTFPITAVVTYQGRTRAMTTPAPSGDCNSCHTENGTSAAPGRIMLP
jgi:hypothetical protein